MRKDIKSPIPKDKHRAFTLVEIILYLGLFLLILTLTYPLIIDLLKNFISLEGKIDIKTEVRNILLKITNELNRSKSIDILTNWEIVFRQKEENRVIFSTKPIYLDTASSVIKGYASNLNIGSLSFSGPTYNVSFSASSSCAINSTTNVSSIYSLSGYAWSPNIGWVKFRNTDGGEPVYGVCLDNNNELRGYAWNNVAGWISFNCLDTNLCSTSNYKVINKNNYLYGYAWNETVSWFIFDGQGGKVYSSKMNPNIYFLDLISDTRVFVDDLSFSKIGESLKISIKIKGPGETYETEETAIILPFK